MDILAGKVSNVSHDTSALIKQAAMKNAWEERGGSGRAERSIAALKYYKERNKDAPRIAQLQQQQQSGMMYTGSGANSANSRYSAAGPLSYLSSLAEGTDEDRDTFSPAFNPNAATTVTGAPSASARSGSARHSAIARTAFANAAALAMMPLERPQLTTTMLEALTVALQQNTEGSQDGLKQRYSLMLNVPKVMNHHSYI